MGEVLHINLLGGLSIRHSGSQLNITLRKAEALLIFLACNPKPHSRQVLASLFWSEQDDTQALTSLRVALNSLRQNLEPYLIISRSSVGFNPEATFMLDACDFETSFAAAQKMHTANKTPTPESVAALERAVSLYQGDFLAGVFLRDSQGFEEWQLAEQGRLRLMAVTALEQLVEWHTTQTQWSKGIEAATRLLQLDSLREETHRALMTLLAYDGQRSAALAQYETCRALLQTEFGVEPETTTTTLYERIKAGEMDRPPLTQSFELANGVGSFLFTDIVSSTRRWEEAPAAMAVAIQQHNDILQSCIEAQGGFIFQTAGDSFSAAFVTPVDAITAAYQAQKQLLAHPWSSETGPLAVRMALHTGPVETRSMISDGLTRLDFFGPPTFNRLSRLLHVTHGNQVLLTGDMQAALQNTVLPNGISWRNLGARRLRDLAQPEQIYQLTGPGLPADFPALQTLDNRPNNLPGAPNAFVGREVELKRLTDLLRRPEVRLVTLTGPGGMGKTRLSLQVARLLLDDFEHGVWFVPLAALRDPDLVASTIVQTLGIKESFSTDITALLQNYLADKQILLVLDNWEQIIEGSPLVGELLKAAPGLKVLATSREELDLYGEYIFPVPPLPMPDLPPTALPPFSTPFDFGTGGSSSLITRADPKTLARNEAVALFAARSQAAVLDFELNSENTSTVAQICRRLDGLPLAIELAATRTRRMSLNEILDQLNARLAILTGGPRDMPNRHRALRTTIDWSYDLLDAHEKLLFARLGVFTGGWTVAAAEQICAGWITTPASVTNPKLDSIIWFNAPAEDAISIPKLLTALVDKSLVRQITNEAGEPRFMMLETIREYAVERLLQSGEEREMRRRHLAYFIELVEASEAKLRGPEQIVWLKRLEAERDNLRAARSWAIEQDLPEELGRLAAASTYFNSKHGHIIEGRQWVDTALSRLHRPAPDALTGKLLCGQSYFAFAQSDYALAWSCAEQAVEHYRALNHAEGLGDAYLMLGWTAHNTGDYIKSRELHSQALQHKQAAGETTGQALAMLGIANAHSDLAEYTPSRAHFEQAVNISRAAGDSLTLARALHGLASVTYRSTNDAGKAIAYAEESLALKRELGDRSSVAGTMLNMGMVIHDTGDIARAQAIYEEALAIFRENDEKYGIAFVLNVLGTVLQEQGDLTTALTYHEESLKRRRELGDLRGVGSSLHSLGRLALLTNQPQSARSYFCESLRTHIKLRHRHSFAFNLADFGLLAQTLNQPDRALTLFGAAKAMLLSLDGANPHFNADYLEAEQAARATLAAELAEAAYQTGLAMNCDAAISYALEEEP